MESSDRKPVVGIALGSGSARGWSHIGVIQQLEEMGIRPQVIAGTSIGALVGAVYAAGQLQDLADWVRTLTVRDVVGLMDFSFSGGVVRGERLFATFNERHANPNIEDLDQRYVSVCTEMKSGREIWITHGPILTAARASCALPGVFSPVEFDGRWMLDGGLVNPVPVSACRAMGADVVIAVNLNAQLVGAHLSRASRQLVEDAVGKQAAAEAGAQQQDAAASPASAAKAAENGASKAAGGFWQRVIGYFESSDPSRPGLFDVLASSINIMQDRITRSRMAGDPPEVTLIPLLEDFALMDFHRAAQAIEEGRDLVRRHEAELRAWTRQA
ncbi:MAG: patatin-like phospholipase RssA [Sinimarinibacterium sp.]|jgi:NTE family protein